MASPNSTGYDFPSCISGNQCAWCCHVRGVNKQRSGWEKHRFVKHTRGSHGGKYMHTAFRMLNSFQFTGKETITCQGVYVLSFTVMERRLLWSANSLRGLNKCVCVCVCNRFTCWLNSCSVTARQEGCKDSST